MTHPAPHRLIASSPHLPGSILSAARLIFFVIILLPLPVPAAPATQPAAPELRTKMEQLDYGAKLRQTGLYLFFIVLALWLAGKFLPRYLNQTPPLSRHKLIQIIETRRLDPKKTLYLVKLGEQYYLIGSTPDRLETLAGAPLDPTQLTAALHDTAPQAPGDFGRDKPAPKSFLDLLKTKS